MFKRGFLISLLLFGFATGCKRNATNPYGVPNVFVSIGPVDIDNGSYTLLLNTFGWVYVSGGYNNNGIILYCQSPGSYLAFDRNCPYDCQTNSKAIITVLPGNIQAKCPVFGTVYSLYSGARLSGPGSLALKQYYTQYIDPNLSVSSSPF